MSIHVALYHKTRYSYDRPTGHGPHVIRLRPAPHCRAAILSYSQKIIGGEHFINWQQDPFSNWNARLVFPDKMTEFCVEVELVVEMAVHNPFDFFLEKGAENFPFTYEPTLKKDLSAFLEPAAADPQFSAWLVAFRKEIGDQPIRTNDFLVALNQRVQRSIKYLIRLESGVQPPEETLTKASGSCRDSAWLLVQLLRHLGLAARFVSGYLIQLTADEKSLDGPSGPTQDFTDLHAWCEVYLPGAGWIGLDATSGLLAGEGHIPLSCTPEPSSAAPVSGAVDKCEATLLHEMRVSRIYESARVTKPYSEEQWEQIQALGRTVDKSLAETDVRLTMGGEPTFVSMDDPDGPEWNFTAVSHKKRVLSGTLLRRLKTKFAPGALLHYGQGKWYPGEELPRWALGCYWRKDGVPVWKDDSLIADESKNYGYGPTEAKELGTRIAENLGVDAQWLMPGYEDAFYYMWKERRLPSNVTPEKSNLKNRLERERLTRIFQQGLGEVVGYALPLKRRWYGGEPFWLSGSWFFRDDEVLWLIPGDSAMGLRLPTDSIPWVMEKDYPWIYQPDPCQKFPSLPKEFLSTVRPGQRFVAAQRAPMLPESTPGQRAQQLDEKLPPTVPPLSQQSAPWVIRTALCVEPREGRLHIFIPPVSCTEDYLDIIAGVEAAAKSMGTPVIIEGETPPKDPRLHKLAVTPDPGVIEVNLHPSATWDELVEKTTVLYEEARQTRLRGEKFMLDGRHVGTGGGNHIVIGGASSMDSPVLRRPDLLRSLLTYWQNHPSLSWLFSGMFIGPTSQAPRVDEARNDSLYELELAFQQTPGPDKNVPPWVVDRLFRNLLIDSSGNTHRAEFSIDKLFPPDASGGRLGLVEMRAFEMPPHARMSVAQQLLLRGLIARFWKQPCTNELVRWGTDLHDRWLLPHFCETDFNDVIADLQKAGYPFDREWFAPHFEFRFPRLGDFAQRDITVELRGALEPWHVLGEEAGPGGTVRYVDSSVERLQVKATGMIGNRFAITCNGRRVPLNPTGANGEFVAGVRYRAWCPPECLHPQIGVDAPLIFDLYDTWNKRSLGGCTYNVAHPGGLSYSTFPINAYEAESRRLSRFFVQGHKQAPFTPPDEPKNSDFPFTLDLRTEPSTT